MQILGYVDRHEGESYSASRIGCVLDMAKDAVNLKLRNLRDIGLIEFSSGKRTTTLTTAGRKMLWPFGDFK